MKISQPVLDVLSQATVNGNTLTLAGELDRKLYTDTAKVIEMLGGKWNRSAKCHIFPEDVEGVICDVLTTGEVVDMKKEFQFFETPQALVEKIVDLANVQPGYMALEPSAGKGAIVLELLKRGAFVFAHELDIKNVNHLNAQFGDHPNMHPVVQADFLTVVDSPAYDVVVMNPPFSKMQDIDHVTHAFKFLKPGGRLVAIMSPSWTFRETKKAEVFRDLYQEFGVWTEDVDAGAFKQSGTMVKTCIVVLGKPL